MTKYSPYILFILITIFLSALPETLYAQRSAAELISVMPPPQGAIKYKDGVRQITILDHYLFVTNFWAGLQVVDISDIRNPKQVAFLPAEDESYYTYIEGEYAYLANHATGVQVYSIKDMDHIHKVAEIKPPGNALCMVTEFPTMFVAQGDEGFAVMDISDFNNPVTIKLEIPGEWIQHLYKKDNLLFLAAKTGGLIIYDVSDLENPRKLSQFRTGYNSMMVQVIDDIAFIADGPGGMLAVNVKNPQFPRELKRFSDIGFVGHLYKAGNYVYLANREVGLQIINVSDPARPFLESRYDTDDINYGVYKKDIYVFLAANVATLIMRHNNAPQLEDLIDMQLPENAPFTLQMKAKEPDGDAIQYEIFNTPEGAAFDAQTGTLTWTPTYEQSGVYSKIIFRVVEQTATRLSAADTIALIVNHVNRLPDLPALENATVSENAILKFTIPQGSDPDKEDQQRLAYRAEKLPAGATFDPATRTFSWTPTYEQSGLYPIDFLIDDGAGGIDREPMTITVSHIDRKPFLTAVEPQTVDEGKPLTIQIAGEEPDKEDQDKVTFKMENLPEGAVFDPAARTLSWTPAYDQSATYSNVKAIMVAGNLSDTTTLVINVNHVNRAPVLAEVGNQAVLENQTLTFTVSGSDPDAEDESKLMYSAANLPSGASFDPATRTFSWTPGFDQSGQYSDVAFTVKDPGGLSDTRQVPIIATHVNRTPRITALEARSASENQAVEFQVSGSDLDAEDSQKLTYSALQLPEGATLDSQTGAFRWMPTFDQSGEYELKFVLSDGQYSDTTAMKLTIAHVNRAPALAAIEPQAVDENQPLTFTISGQDSDREDEGLLAFAVQNLPEGAAFDPSARAFTWTPTYEQSGQYEIPFTVTDPTGLADQKSVTITVNHVNRAPTLQAVAAQTVDENQSLTIQLIGADPDQEDAGKLIYEAANLPPNAQLDPASGLINWTPAYDQSGQYTLNVLVKDPAGLNAPQSLAVTVNNINRPPEFEALPAQAGKENGLLQFSAKANDPDVEDAGKLIYASANLPEGAALDQNSGQVTWTPTFEQSGDYTISFQVTDGFGASASREVAVNIAHVNRSPELPPVAGATFQENAAGNISVPEGQDPDQEDAGKLSYEVTGLPQGAAFNPQSRTLSWTPTFEQAGTYQLTALLKDPGDLSAAQNFTVTVENVNRPPVMEGIPAQNGEENKTIQFTLKVNDPDKDDAGNLAFSANNLPDGARLNASTGEFSWTPNYEQSGAYQVRFEVKDGSGETSSAEVAINVANANRPPQVQSPGNKSVKEGETLSFGVSASDQDQEDSGNLQIEAKNLPGGARFSNGEFNWTPGKDQQGSHNVEFIAKDPGGQTDRVTITIQVEDVPEEQAP